MATTTPATDDPPLANVTTQGPSVGPGPQGTLVSGYKIGFVTRSGVNGTVFIANSEFTEENARAKVKAEATKLEAVQNTPVY